MIELPKTKVPLIKDGKRYLCTVEHIPVRGGSNIIHVAEDGTIIKQEPFHRYKERESRRKLSTTSV